MKTIHALVLHPTVPTGSSDAEALRSDNTPPEGGVDGAPAESPYATLNDHSHPPPENVYGLASASSLTDLTLALGGNQRRLSRTPSPDYEDVGPRSPRSRTPSPDYEQVDLPGNTPCAARPPANHPPPLPANHPPPLSAKPSKPGVYFELEPQIQTGKKPPPLPAKPPKSPVHDELQPPPKPPRTFAHDGLQPAARPKSPPPPPPQHLKPGRTPGAAGSPVVVGDEKKDLFQSVKSELAARLATRRIE